MAPKKSHVTAQAMTKTKSEQRQLRSTSVVKMSVKQRYVSCMLPCCTLQRPFFSTQRCLLRRALAAGESWPTHRIESYREQKKNKCAVTCMWHLGLKSETCSYIQNNWETSTNLSKTCLLFSIKRRLSCLKYEQSQRI